MCKNSWRTKNTVYIRMSGRWRLKNQRNLVCVLFSHQVMGADFQVQMIFAGIFLHPVWGCLCLQTHDSPSKKWLHLPNEGCNTRPTIFNLPLIQEVSDIWPPLAFPPYLSLKNGLLRGELGKTTADQSQTFLNFGVHQNHLEAWWKCTVWGRSP